MAEAAIFEPGGYRYVPGPFQYSGGVAAEPGYAIERVRFASRPAIEDGFKLIENYLDSIGRPYTSFCACELRSPAPFTEQGFIDFNRIYVGTLERWGVFRDEKNPVARSNVCPELDAPPVPSFEAFSYTVPATTETETEANSGGTKNFVVAGSGEAPEGHGTYEERIIRRGDTSADAMREKAQYVLGEMERRMAVLGFDWTSATTTQVYTVHDLHPFLADELVGRGATPAGLTWYYARPPVVDLEYEMDVRSVPVERVL